MNCAPVFVAAIGLMALAGGVGIARGGAQPESGGVSPGVRSQVDRMMARDADGDGVLSREELPGRLAERLFEADADASGTLTREELEQHFAQRGRGRPAPGDAGDTPQAAGADDDAVFEGAMKQAGLAMRTLSRTGFEATTRDSDLDAVQTMQEAMIMAKASFGAVGMSATAAAKYRDDQAAYRRDFRLALVGSLRAALDIEEALLGDDVDGAKAALGRLMENQNASHIVFQD